MLRRPAPRRNSGEPLPRYGFDQIAELSRMPDLIVAGWSHEFHPVRPKPCWWIQLG
jgi:hypothetical protein